MTHRAPLTRAALAAAAACALAAGACKRSPSPARKPAAAAPATPASGSRARGEAQPPASAPASAPHASPAADPRTARARAAAGDLKRRLVGALKAALAEGGPEAAITACHDKAPGIAAAASAGGVTVGRTSHRLRNPKNAPPPWVAPILKEMVAKPPARGSYRVVALPGGALGYVEPLFTAPLCVTCHGEKLAPSLAERIRALYPEDRATGFRPGDLRGLVWARVEAATTR